MVRLPRPISASVRRIFIEFAPALSVSTKGRAKGRKEGVAFSSRQHKNLNYETSDIDEEEGSDREPKITDCRARS